MKNPEETLDPENWEESRKLGHKILDDMFNHIRDSRKGVFQAAKESEMRGLTVPLTKEGEGEEKPYQDFYKYALPSLVGGKTARFWGYVIGGGSHYGVLADMIASEVNFGDMPMMATGAINSQALNYVREMLEYPKGSGVFVSGGSEANFTGLAVARNALAEIDLKTKGMQSVPKKMTLYMSDQGHDCLDRSVEILGLGNEALRRVPTDEKFKIRVDLLKDAIEKDRADGYHPFCIIGCAGTVNTGAFDDFNALADLAEKEKMWFHVDGAFGAWVKISKTHKQLANGMERADSLAVDLHKWMDMPYEIGCTLTRHPREHLETFVYGHDVAYLKTAFDKFTTPEEMMSTMNLGLRLSNHTTAIKPYLLLRANGSEKYSRLVQQNIDQINYLADLIRKESSMEICAPVESNIVCFRYKPKGLNEEQSEKLNKAILQELWKFSLFVISDTHIKGKYVIRVCNVNHRSCRDDFDWLVSEVKKVGERLVPEVVGKG